MNKILLLLVFALVYIYADTCESQGDPHVRTFTGTWWEFQKEGDYVLLNNKDLLIQTRQRHWGQTAFVITGFAIKFSNGHSFVMTTEGLKQAIVDGKKVALKQSNGIALTLGNISVQRNNNQIKFLTPNTEITVSVNDQPTGAKWPQTHYQNILINVKDGTNKNGWTGACVAKGSMIKDSSAFSNGFVNHHHGPRPHLCTKKQLERAKRRCQKRGFKTKKHFDICVFDTCHGFRAIATRRFFDRAERAKHLRNRDLRTLIERAARAVKFRKLMVSEGKIISRLSKEYDTLRIQYRKVVAKERAKRGELSSLKRLEIQYKSKVTRFKSEEHSFRGQLYKYRQQRRNFQQKLIYLKKEE